ncbi:hypothetical protein [Devosia enhydra]|nr:hypothetical protein [Devosia enhydra]
MAMIVVATTASNASELAAECEAAIIEQLTAPSTFRLVAFDERAVPLTADDWLSLDLHNRLSVAAVDAAYAAGILRPVAFIARVRYEALNAFGVPIRSEVLCALPTETGLAAPVDASSLILARPGSIEAMLLEHLMSRSGPG